MSSQYLISTRWMSPRVLLRSLGRCCLGLVVVLVAGGAAEVLSVSLNCPLPLQRTHPPTLVCCFCVFAAMGVTSTKSGRLEVNMSLSEKRGGKCHLETILLTAVSEIWRFCMVIRSLLSIFSYAYSFLCCQSISVEWWLREAWKLWPVPSSLPNDGATKHRKH